MKILIATMLTVIISATQQCNNSSKSGNSSEKTWTEPAQSQQTSQNQQSTTGQPQQQSPETVNQQTETPQQSQQDPANFRLSVSFYSIGSGIDHTAKESFDKFLGEYKPAISVQPKRWGREGEIDYCFRLSELSASQQAEFVKKAREVLAGSKLVHVNENAPCKN